MAIIFGPVPSRRYGRSLGIDLVPMKTCCYDCLFCQLGVTPQTTLDRKEYVAVNQVIKELEAWLSRGESVDILTLCGSGEPTLHSRFGEVLQWIHEHTSLPSLLMSNGALFADPDVRQSALRASHVKLSLHFWDEASFQQMVRPAPGLRFEAIYEGWLEFRKAYHGALDMEFFAMPGINTSPAQINQILPLFERLHPDSITVNTAVRPPAESVVKTVPAEELAQLQKIFATVAHTQHAVASSVIEPYSEEALLALVRRHPLRPDQFARYFGVSEAQIREALERFAQTDQYAARALLSPTPTKAD